MNNTDNYIASSSIFPEWLMMLSEGLTIIASLVLVTIFLFLWIVFVNYTSDLDKKLRRTFGAKFWQALISFTMGVSLYLDWAEGVKAIVVIRPWVLFYVGYAFYDLGRHYLALFNDTPKHLLSSSFQKLISKINRK